MYDITAADRRGPVVAIVGGGASGTLAAVHLLRAAAARRIAMRIVLIDRSGRHGLGQAYGTGHGAHLLNTPARQMSALADDPDHLVRWAQLEGSTAAADGDGDGDLAGAFLPRRDYGRYLQDTLWQAERRAQPLARLIRASSQVLAVRAASRGRALRLILGDGVLDADYAVLATGNLPSALPFPAPPSPRIITDPWAPGALEQAADGSPVVIAGTGLTMLDAAVAVTSGGNRAPVHAISRHGLLPRVHRGLPSRSRPLWLPVLGDKTGPVRLPELLWQVRMAMKSRPDDWQDVVDGLRPYLPGLWQRLPDADRKLFLRHLARYWEVHRHRVPPATARRITALRCAGQLTVQAGRITGVTETTGGLRVQLAGLPPGPARAGAGAGTAELTAGWLINATGPAADVTTAADPLLADLLGSGLARPDPLRLGLDATANGAVVDAGGTPSRVIFAIGPPLRGVRYETTAIREIREQAAALAGLLTAASAAHARPGSAA